MMRQSFLLLVGMGWISSTHALAVDPIEELKAFSAFDEVNFQQLVDGEILSEKSYLQVPRWLLAQMCFVVMAPPDKIVKFYKDWDVTSHETLKVYLHSHIRSPPSDEDFKSLNFDSGKDMFRRLVDQMQEMKHEKVSLNVNLAEADQIFKWMNAGENPVEAAGLCWRNILKERATKFEKEGFVNLVPYKQEDGEIIPMEEIQNLLNVSAKISAQFNPFLSESILGKHPIKSEVQPYGYWELREINNHAALTLGVIYTKAQNDRRYQMIDCNYYYSRSVYLSCTVRQIWPVKVQGKDASLIWQGEFVSTQTLDHRKGMERMAAKDIMLQEVKEGIRFVQEDAPKHALGQ